MAAPRRRAGAGRRPASRGPAARSGGGRRRPPPRRGGGGGPGIGAGPIIASICILLVGVIGIIFILKDDDAKKPINNTNIAERPDNRPVKRINAPEDPFEGRGPPPLLNKDQQMRAMSVSQRMQSMLAKVKRLQKESVEAKNAGDDDLWQEKLGEAAGVYGEMKDMWNEIVAELPSNDKWDKEQVANHWLLAAVKPLEEAGRVVAGSDKTRRK